jgi:anti-sigma regulatory factor (Ser/Thr protein kinase)
MSPSLSKPPAAAETLTYDAEIASVRRFIATRARRAGLSPDRIEDLVLAVSELAANTLAHTDGAGTLLVWATEDYVVCQVHDSGRLPDQQAGGSRPDPDELGGGRGLWVVRQLCDRVDVRSGPDGTTIRAYMRLPS